MSRPDLNPQDLRDWEHTARRLRKSYGEPELGDFAWLQSVARWASAFLLAMCLCSCVLFGVLFAISALQVPTQPARALPHLSNPESTHDRNR